MSKLILIPTPIGNLGDITQRAVECIKTVDILLCEDTRRSLKLLNHLKIKKPLKSYHKFNEHSTVEKVINEIQSGLVVGLISDAGTPSISDPGYLIVKMCIDNNIEVECLPGPTALIPALAVSGLPSERFVFEGFLPVKKGRKTRLEELSNEKRTMIFYESPYKLYKTLQDFSNSLGPDREISISKELTKIFESTTRGRIKDLMPEYENKKLKGEFVIVVKGLK
jgi:probable S-adenosylmethionine-dependent methyltransferase, YraL family